VSWGPMTREESMAAKPKAKIFRGVSDDELKKIRKDHPEKTFDIQVTKLNGTSDVTITKKKN
jgi:hypothetical protein